VKTDIDALIKEGWSVVPLLPGEKKANSSWQRKGYGPNDFNPDSNVAGKCGAPSQDRVDVDCDAPEAVAAAGMLLPVTRTHGRTTKPRSHYWYVVPGVKTTQFTDVKDSGGKTAMLVEIRGTGSYTMLPPSVHPSTDVLAWENESVDFLARTVDENYNEARAVAIAAIVARHYPDHGAKHFAIGQYLPGFLLQAGLDAALVKHIIKAAATIAGDGDWEDRRKAIDATIVKFKNGEPVAGGPKLADAIGEDVVTKLRAWLRVADLDALDTFNERHFFVRLGKDSVIGREDDPDEVVFQTPAALTHEYANKLVQTGTDKDGEAAWAPLFDTWMKSPSRRSYSRVVFAPPPLEASDTEFNLWRGYSVAPAASHAVLPFLEHVRQVICSDDPEWYEYLMNLMALTIQRPGIPTGVAVVMRGLMGAGKGVVLEWLGALVAQHYRHLTKSDQVVGRFNKAIAGKVIVFLDEAFWAGDKREIGALKSLITEKFLEVEPKNIDSFPVRNVAHVFIATNNEWAVPAGLDERRFFALKVADTYSKATCADAVRKRYFDRLWTALAHGGAEALLHLLMTRDVSTFDRFAVPSTPELRKQQAQTVDGWMRWLYDCVYSEAIVKGGWPAQRVEFEELYLAYHTWCESNRKSAISKVQFGTAIAKYLYKGGKTQTTTTKGKALRMVVLNTPAEVKQLLPSISGVELETVELTWNYTGKVTMHVTDDEA